MSVDTSLEPTLAQRRTVLRGAEPKLYARDQAAQLGVSECELLDLDEGHGATRLRPDWTAILGGLHQLGPVMALTRNADAVHEKVGTYGQLEGGRHVGLFVGDAIDLRLFLGAWRHGWAVQAPAGRRSLQFFGPDGSAVHKVYATADTDLDAWVALVTAHAATGHDPLAPAIEATKPPAVPRPDAEVDREAFLTGWDGLRDTHHFHGLLLRHKLARTQALRLAGPERARSVGLGALRAVLEAAAASGLSIMVFVGNRGCIQIHTGPVHTLRAAGPWFNVLDPAFNLHLREPAIATAWVVAKPTEDGPVTSLELFDAAGDAVATLFGRRKPGQAEDPAWRTLLDHLPGLDTP